VNSLCRVGRINAGLRLVVHAPVRPGETVTGEPPSDRVPDMHIQRVLRQTFARSIVLQWELCLWVMLMAATLPQPRRGHAGGIRRAAAPAGGLTRVQ